jgi:hypothetical protein
VAAIETRHTEVESLDMPARGATSDQRLGKKKPGDAEALPGSLTSTRRGSIYA